MALQQIKIKIGGNYKDREGQLWKCFSIHGRHCLLEDPENKHHCRVVQQGGQHNFGKDPQFDLIEEIKD